MKRLREEAARQGKTISELVEAALRLSLQSSGKKRERPPRPHFDSGGALIDIADRASLYQAMEGR